MRFRIAWGCLCLITLTYRCLQAQTGSGMAAIRVASGLSQPVFVIAPPGDYGRLFIVRQTGQVYILNLATLATDPDPSHALNSTPFLDIQSFLTPTNGEQGLLGMAFDPNYASNGKFYLNFTVPSAPGDIFQAGVTHVSQFAVLAGNPDLADPVSIATIGTVNEKILVSFQHPQSNHNGGWIGFSPRSGDDHNLYIATGDGGSSDDQDGGFGHIEPSGNAQNLTTLLGKMLRIHVDANTATVTIPPDNHFAGSGSNITQKIWAYGLRNPFRNSFDRVTGRMFIGDVGQGSREEVDAQETSNPGGGENYEWRLREGTISTPGGNPPVGGPRPSDGVDPIFDYDRSVGQTIIGGYVYRGAQMPQLRGTYVFDDYATPRIFTLNYDGTIATNFQDITSQLFPTSQGNYPLSNPSSFGEDANGELYVTDIGNGNVYKIVPVTPNLVITSIARLGDGHILLQCSGVPFRQHTIQATDNLTQPFVPLGTGTAAGNGSFQFEDTGATSFTTRFYRIALP